MARKITDKKTARPAGSRSSPVLSCDDAPLLLHDSRGTLVAALKLERIRRESGTVVIDGWVFGAAMPGLLTGVKRLAATIRRHERADVSAAFGAVAGPQAGFELACRVAADKSLLLEWAVTLDGRSSTLHFRLPEPGHAGSAPATSGALDGFLDGALHGWACNEATPDLPVIVECLLDDRVLGETRCDLPRPDLASKGMGAGNHGFHWTVPDTVMPADVARLQVRISGTSAPLPGKARPLYSTLAATRSYDGGLDADWPHSIRGYVMARRRPLPACVELLIDGEVVSQLGLQRCAPPQGKRGATARFDWTVPAVFADVQASRVTLRLPEGQLLELGLLAAKNGGGRQQEVMTALQQPVIEGRIERLDTGVVSGWCWDPRQPDQPLDVALKVDGSLVAVARANRFAARLRNERRSGHHAFVFAMPSACFNGANRQVAVEVLDAGIELPAPTDMLAFPLVAMPRLADEPPVLSAARYAPDWHSAMERRVLEPKPAKAAGKTGVRVSMIMLNWNGEHLLQDFFASFQRHLPALRYELLIVDHGSTDGSLPLIRRHAKQLPITLIARGDNHSFADSNNLAARTAKGELLLFLNNDMVWQHDCVSVMARVLDDPRIGIVGAHLLEPLKEAGGRWSFAAHHEGIRFRSDALPDNGGDYYTAEELADVPVELSAAVITMPAVTAALMLCRKAEFLRTGGFCTDYVYGMEDVDFCLEFTRRTGKHIVVAMQATAIHNRSATRELKTTTQEAPKSYNAATHVANRKAFIRRQGAALTGTVLRSLLAGSAFYRRQPLRVVFAVTEAGVDTAAGDFYTAMELGKALERQYGWEIFFIEHGTHAIPGTDVLVAMRHDFPLRHIRGANPGLVTVAWIRNRTDEWLANDCFADYQLVFASSGKIIDKVREHCGRHAVLLPIATNPERFTPERADVAHASDVVFTGNNHGAVRGGLDLLAPNGKDYDFALYGHRWEDSKQYRRFHRGALRYDEMAKAYASSKLVLDDAHTVTNAWDSLNSRVFDAIACGKVVLTNCAGGARALFGNKLPVYATAAELKAKVKALLVDDRKRERLARDLREHVLAHHTYAQRAVTFKSALDALLAPGVIRFAIKVPVPTEAEKQLWGDYHFALGIKRALERQGHHVRIDLLPQWQAGTGAADDVVLVLRGLSRYKPKPNTINLLWLMSHPDAVTADEMKEYDHVFVASQSYAARLVGVLGDKVSPLLQCTDPQLFHPEPAKGLKLPPVLFVGNSRGQRREAVDNALACHADLAVFGTGWQDKLPAGIVRGDHVPNDTLRRYYSTATVVLNDHWPDMRREGFLSNRLFDAGACGAVLLSDDAQGMQDIFGKALPTWSSAATFSQQLERLLGDAAWRKQLSAAIRKQVLAGHTFDHRMAVLLDRLAQLRNTP